MTFCCSFFRIPIWGNDVPTSFEICCRDVAASLSTSSLFATLKSRYADVAITFSTSTVFATHFSLAPILILLWIGLLDKCSVPYETTTFLCSCLFFRHSPNTCPSKPQYSQYAWLPSYSTDIAHPYSLEILIHNVSTKGLETSTSIHTFAYICRVKLNVLGCIRRTMPKSELRDDVAMLRWNSAKKYHTS